MVSAFVACRWCFLVAQCRQECKRFRTFTFREKMRGEESIYRPQHFCTVKGSRKTSYADGSRCVLSCHISMATPSPELGWGFQYDTDMERKDEADLSVQ